MVGRKRTPTPTQPNECSQGSRLGGRLEFELCVQARQIGRLIPGTAGQRGAAKQLSAVVNARELAGIEPFCPGDCRNSPVGR